MEISDIRVLNLIYRYPKGKRFCYKGGEATHRTTSLVEVTTNSGEKGVGSAYSHPDLVKIIIEEHIRPHLIGEKIKNADDIKKLWEKMYRLTRWYGRKGVAVSALGGIDIALWDLRGKAVNKPIYKLLGEEECTRVPAYASALFWKDDFDELTKEAEKHIKNGYCRLKMRLGRNIDYDIQAVKEIRKLSGDNVDILVDGSMAYDYENAKRLAKVLEKENIFWFEEPFEPENLDTYAKLRKEVKVPIAAGENEFTHWGFRECLRSEAFDIIQPDASRTGGITPSFNTGKLAEEHGLQVATHTWSDSIALVANMHIIAALTNGITVEIDCSGNPFIEKLLSKPLSLEKGCLKIPQGSGLGINIDYSFIKKYCYKNNKIENGNYSDMIFGKAN